MQVSGISTQPINELQEATERLYRPYLLLSDAALTFAEALTPPTFTLNGQRYLKRVTLIVQDGVIEKVFYPVFPPTKTRPRSSLVYALTKCSSGLDGNPNALRLK